MFRGKKNSFPSKLVLSFCLFSLVLVFLTSLCAVCLASPTLSEVLAQAKTPEHSPLTLTYWSLAAVACASLVALSFKGYDVVVKQKKEIKPLGLFFGSADDEQQENRRKEMKELLFKNEELSRENQRLAEDRKSTDEEKIKLENVIQNRAMAEELLKKSNESLRRSYDKLLAEKDMLLLKINQKDFSAAAGKEFSPRGGAGLQAIESLINEVGASISAKERKVPKKRTKAATKAEKATAVKKTAKKAKKR